MKKCILIMILGVSSIMTAFSQQVDTSYLKYMKQDLIRRSANNRKAGFILLGAGAGMVAGGIVGMLNSTKNEESFIAFSGLTGFGMMSGLVSLPFFVISGSQSLRASRIQVQVKIENHHRNLQPLASGSGQLPNTYSEGFRQIPVSMGGIFYPAISISMGIGK